MYSLTEAAGDKTNKGLMWEDILVYTANNYDSDNETIIKGLVALKNTYQNYIKSSDIQFAKNLVDNNKYKLNKGNLKKTEKTDSVITPYTDKTPKTDILSGTNRISLKLGKEYQLTSAGFSESSGLFTGAVHLYGNIFTDKLKKDISTNIVAKLYESKYIVAEHYKTEIDNAILISFIMFRYKSLNDALSSSSVSDDVDDKWNLLDVNGKIYSYGDFKKNNSNKPNLSAISSHAVAELKQVMNMNGKLSSSEIKGIDLLDKDTINSFLTSDKPKNIINTVIDNDTFKREMLEEFIKNGNIVKDIKVFLNKLFTENEFKEFKKYCVFEALTGTYKFGGIESHIYTIPNSVSVPTHILIINPDSEKVNIIPATFDSINKYFTDNKVYVKITPSVKSTKNAAGIVTQRNVLRFMPINLNESQRYNLVVKRLFESAINKHKNGLNEFVIKKYVKDDDKYVDTVFDRLIDNIKLFMLKLLDSGIDKFLNFFGIVLEGTAEVGIDF
jgi:hypothetical protein